ncbi:MAG TPA: hypothetical protein VLC91_09255, partial [Spongiibacteraceae bacterium]|nr:hypothetical protein [Spongiibacteraceae bacterium]
MIETLMAWIPSLLISLLAVSAFLYVAYSSRSQIDKLQRVMRQNSEQLVEDFLQREGRITRHRLQTQTTANNSDPARRLAHMRRCWLDAELAALMEGGQRHSDYALLESAAMPLLRLTRQNDDKNSAAGTQLWSSVESKHYLQRTRAAVASQKQLIQEFKARNTAPGESAIDRNTAQTRQDHARHAGLFSALGNVENNSTTLLETIEKLERELAIAQSKYDVVQKKLAVIETNRKTNPTDALNHLTITKDFNRSNSEENHELLNEMESAYTNSINEMKKMGDINRQQRQLILEMEKEITLLRKDSSEYQISSDVLNKLKLQLRDYENCTTILEMESETLREQIQNLRRTIADNDLPGQPTALDATAVAPPIEPESKSVLVESGVLELIEHLASAESLERAGAHLVAWLTKKDISSVVYIKGKQEQIWVSSEGRVDDHSKQLLKSMMPSAGQPITEVREGVMFIYSACRILLYGKGEFHERNSREQLWLRDIFAATDHILQLFQERLELRQTTQNILTVQKKLKSLMVQHNYIDAEHLRTGANFRKEIDEY